ncbi:hypothetical protein DERF_005658 [Dermatophagoides farinae]|uniref:Ribonuclease t2-like protein n=1 Tax=Dermatophagoides farinae TaxID=6954 RepID=A0A922LBH6_DERFA|nr:uncharacterized protein LOC124490019 [Dermatophagoides farinae]KAH7639352.1 ribonuclease t2 precursor-like protein [Dermatophagoides farinae]KAH9522055.1 hypothetical protein DERF_005658 [Dermatophagoides farinae]
MPSYSLNDICCPPSYNGESRRARWFFLGLFVFIGFMIIFILIGLAAGLWKHAPEQDHYLILSRQWPITVCIARQCDEKYRDQQEWLINGLQSRIAGEKPLKNCEHEENDFKPESVKDEKDYFATRWPNLDPLPHTLTIKEPTEKPTTTATSTVKTTTVSISSSTTKKPDDKPDDDKHNEKQWSKEWKQYGTCYDGKQADYFQTIMELDKTYLLKEAKISEKIIPNTTALIELNTLAKTLAEYFNKKNEQKWDESMFEFVCKLVINTNKNDDDDDAEQGQHLYLLEEIRMCFGVMTTDDGDKKKQVHKPIECFDRSSYGIESPYGCFGQQSVRYPNAF